MHLYYILTVCGKDGRGGGGLGGQGGGGGVLIFPSGRTRVSWAGRGAGVES